VGGWWGGGGVFLKPIALFKTYCPEKMRMTNTFVLLSILWP